jgi:putative two-component system hydrogenase maturation factor HypX/HoxX
MSIEFDISDSVTEEAVALFKPDLIIAPFLKRAIPEVDLVAPSLPDRPSRRAGRSRAIGAGLGDPAQGWEWGVTVLQAEAEMDAGPVWASANFPMAAHAQGLVNVPQSGDRSCRSGRHC